MNDLFNQLLHFPYRVYRKLRFEWRVATGLGFKDRSSHRLPLEELIFPYFVQDSRWHTLLFVGCALSSLWYNKVFAGKEYWTLDIDPAKARLGSPRHIIDGLQNLSVICPSLTFR